MRPIDSGDGSTIPGRTRPLPRVPQAPGDGGPRRARHRYRPNRPSNRLGSAARGLVGTLVGGWFVLALLLVGVQVWAASINQAGPGIVAVIAHLVLAILAIALQAVADRRYDGVGRAALFGAFVLVIGSLWFWWWG